MHIFLFSTAISLGVIFSFLYTSFVQSLYGVTKYFPGRVFVGYFLPTEYFQARLESFAPWACRVFR